ncbi:Mitochondrial-processing peptidase subunit beta, partial [Pseudolycoriella hygida]
QETHRKMTFTLMKLSMKFRALSKTLISRKQTVFDNAMCLPQDVTNSFYSSVNKYDLRSYSGTLCKAVDACVMCDEMIQNVQKEWMRICTIESEIERANNVLKTNLLLQSSLHHSYPSNRTSIQQPNRKMSSYTPFSIVRREEIAKIAGVNVTKLLSNPVLDVNKIIRVRELPLVVLKKIYETLCYFIGGFGIPNAYSKESVCSVYVSAVLAGVV